MTGFVHLHTHSHYSLLNALPKVKELVAAAKEAGMPALALTDNGNLYGAIEFYQACKKEDIRPIIGIDAYLSPRGRLDKEAGIDKPRARLVLLAENQTGYKNLIKLVTASYLEGFYYKPRLDRELIEKYHGGLIAVLPSFSGETTLSLKADDETTVREHLDWYKKTFGANNVFLEVTHHPEIPGHEYAQEKIAALSRTTETPLVAAHDVYYLRPEDRLARETMIKIQQGGAIHEESFDESEEDFSFISKETAQEYFRDLPDAIENTAKISERCNLEIEMKWMFPKYVIESGRTPDEELRELAYAGIKWRGMERSEEVLKRIDYELEVIKNKGYATYFLVVGDLLREARERKILTTIRGSVAGSLVTYLAGITNVDPLEYKLPFERFLNPERPSAPDIDMDFADNRRDEIIEYTKGKYGHDNVAQIGTFGTMLARAVVRDVARALGHPYATGDKIAKLIPMGSQGFPMTINRAIDTEAELEKLYKDEPDVQEIIDLAKKIEGRVRHVGVHAAGVVISPDPLIEHVPLQYDPKASADETGKLITQYNMHSVGEDGIGLLKFDFLGIKNLSILADAVLHAQRNHGVQIDIENIPLDDKKTFEMLARGETMGLFQLNGSGMTRYLKELKPSRIHDINAMVALYRPGPMETIPQYIERKHNAHLISYLDSRMKDYLDFSYGVLVYQDDVLLTAINLAGYSWLEADMLRKAMGKKIPAVMAAEKEKLVEGLIANGKEFGMDKQKAEKVWMLIEPFAAYGFNKAHAASYGKVAYQTSYMKANFPVEYMAALLTADSGNVDKVAEAIGECVRMDIPVLPPDVNESFEDFTVVRTANSRETLPQASADARAFYEINGAKIRFGLRSIKNFGDHISHVIIEERENGGRYADLADFLSRIKDRNLNKKSLESLIKCGALDELGERGSMLQNLDHLLQFNKEANAENGQVSLFGTIEGANVLSLAPAEPARQADKLAWEKELLGLYISGHPLDAHKEKLAEHGKSIKDVLETPEGIQTVAAGIISECKIILTKKGERMAFLKLSDYNDSIEAVIFPKIFVEYKDALIAEHVIAVKGRLSGRNGEKSLVVEKVKAL